MDSGETRQAQVAQLRQFFVTWMQDPLAVGAVAPSGRTLAKLMVTGLHPGARVIELGAGTGTVTRAILDAGVQQRDLYLIERNESFARLLHARFPHATLLQEDAAALADQLGALAGSVDFIVSGLPLVLFPRARKERLLIDGFALLKPGGAFHQFTYGGRCPIRRTALARMGLDATLLGIAPFNVPPAFVYRWAAPELVRRAGRATALLAFCAAAACGPDAGTSAVAPHVRALAVPAAAGSGQPQVTADGDGRIVMSWLEPDGDATALRFVTLDAGTWSAPRTAARATDFFVNWADVPSVVPLGADRFAAHWLKLVAGSFAAYDVAVAVSADAGATWSAPVLLNDDGTETEHGFATLFPWNDTLGAVWLDGRQLAEWSFDAPDALLGVSLRSARLTMAGEVLERGEIDALVCDCCQTDVALVASGPIVIYRDRTAEEVRDVVARRFAAGQWLAPVALGSEGWRIEGCPVNGPAIAARGDDVAAAWFTAADGRQRVRFARSSDGGARFAAAIDVDTGDAFGQVDVELLDDATAVVSWWRRASGGGTALAARTVDRDGALGPIHTIASSTGSQPLDVPEMAASDDALVIVWTSHENGGRVQSALVTALR